MPAAQVYEQCRNQQTSSSIQNEKIHIVDSECTWSVSSSQIYSSSSPPSFPKPTKKSLLLSFSSLCFSPQASSLPFLVQLDGLPLFSSQTLLSAQSPPPCDFLMANPRTRVTISLSLDPTRVPLIRLPKKESYWLVFSGKRTQNISPVILLMYY